MDHQSLRVRHQCSHLSLNASRWQTAWELTACCVNLMSSDTLLSYSVHVHVTNTNIKDKTEQMILQHGVVVISVDIKRNLATSWHNLGRPVSGQRWEVTKPSRRYKETLDLWHKANVKFISLTLYSETNTKESNSITARAQSRLSPSLPRASMCTHNVEAVKSLPGLLLRG